MTGLTVIWRTRPLQRRIAQALVTGAPQVITRRRIGEALDFGKNLCRAGVAESFGKTQRASHPGDDLPVRQRLSRRLDRFLHQGERALGIDHHTFGFGPQSARQHDVGIGVGFGLDEGILSNHQFGPFQAVDHRLAIGHRCNRVGTDDPAGLDFAARHALEHRHRTAALARVQGTARQAPDILGQVTLSLDQYTALPWQTRTQVAHLAPAHRIGLPGQGKRPAPGLADRPGGQMQIANRIGIPGAVRALVEPHGPATHPRPGLADHPRRLLDVRCRDAGNRTDPLRCVFGQKIRHHLPTLGEAGNELWIGMAIDMQQMQKPVEQGEIAPWLDLHEQMRLVRRRRLPGIDNNQPGAGLDPIQQAQEQDGMAIGHIGADDQKQIGPIKVLIRPRRTIGPQRKLVTATRARHAQAGVGLDLIGSEIALAELVGQILRFE